jgi:hypothetical protein
LAAKHRKPQTGCHEKAQEGTRIWDEFFAFFRAFLWPNFRDSMPASDFGGSFAALCFFAPAF